MHDTRTHFTTGAFSVLSITVLLSLLGIVRHSQRLKSRIRRLLGASRLRGDRRTCRTG